MTENIFTDRIKSGLREQAWTIHDNVTEVDAYANPPEPDTSLNVTELADHIAKRLAYLIDDIRIVTRKGSSMDPEWWRATERLNVQLNLRPAINFPEEAKVWDGSFNNAIEIMEWVKPPTDYLNGPEGPSVNYREFGKGEGETTHLVIHLPDGSKRIDKGDRIVRDTDGFRVEVSR